MMILITKVPIMMVGMVAKVKRTIIITEIIKAITKNTTA